MSSFSGTQNKGDTLPFPEPQFGGEANILATESTPSFPKRQRPSEGSPNIVLVLLDDVGFGHPSPFGGSVPMPNLQRLADRGLRYNRMHTTAMCSPTRASLLSGRNHHRVANGVITHWATGFPGYHTLWPKSAASVAEILKQHGYSTAALGKWHNTPQWEEGPNGPFDLWPTGLGFEYYYGFFGSDTNQWQPSLIENTKHISPPSTPEEGYHLDRDLTDRAISWVRTQRSTASDKPFFLYWAPGTAHAPHHAPSEWMDGFKGQFDHGWDEQRIRTHQQQIEQGICPPDTKLTPRPEQIPAWDSLSDEQKQLACRLQEAYAAMLAHYDYQFGRFLDELDALGEADNTLIMFLAGDNGPAAEATNSGQINKTAAINGFPEPLESQVARLDVIGGEDANNNYPAGWAWAGSSPFQWLKQIASHFGGTRNGFVVSWPRGISSRGEIRTQFHHCVDVVPTILEVVGAAQPTSVNGVPQMPMDGVSMAYTFREPDAPGRHKKQYFEMMGHRAIYADGWLAGARHRVLLPWQQGLPPVDAPFDDDQWELYNIEVDFSQADDLSAEEPERLKKMQELWLAEAARHNVLPLDDRLGARLVNSGRPNLLATKKHHVFHGKLRGIPEGGAPNVKGRSHSVVTTVVPRSAATEGVLLAIGGKFAGYTLYVLNSQLTYVHNFLGLEQYRVSALIKDWGNGPIDLGFEFVANEPKQGTGGSLTLTVNGERVQADQIPRTVPFSYTTSESLDIGMDTGTAVSREYSVPFEFSGEILRTNFSIAEV